MQNILFFGNSLTAGYGLANAGKESFPALISEKIKKAGMAYSIINAGLSGDTSASGLARLDYWLNRQVAVFVLELGINDIRRSVAPATITQNLQAIIDKVKARYPQVKFALFGMQLPEFLGNAAVQFNQLYRKLADANQMAFVPFLLKGVAGIKHLNLNDRVHPSAEGYQVIAELVWPVIKELLK